jgi:8-oxo-dGTP pyrophosphatase MutT (NUDIX family)
VAPTRGLAGLLARVTGWETRSSREVYTNQWLRVREDQVTRPDGSDGLYGLLELHHPVSFVVPVTDDGEILLVRIERYTVGDSLEVPSGNTDGEDPEVAARRELREETGYVARDWERLGVLHGLNGVANVTAHVFLARGLDHVGGEQHEVEGITAVSAYSWPDVRRMLADGSITDSETVGSLMLAAIELGWA